MIPYREIRSEIRKQPQIKKSKRSFRLRHSHLYHDFSALVSRFTFNRTNIRIVLPVYQTFKIQQ